MDPSRRDDVYRGVRVCVKLPDSTQVNGTVANIVGTGSLQSNGVKVELEDGKIGHVQKFLMDEEDIVHEKLVKNIRKNCKRPENERVEFKETLLFDVNRYNQTQQRASFTNGSHSVAKTIAAFANQQGGTLYIGINDKREIIGLERDFELLEELAKVKSNNFNNTEFELKLKNEMYKIMTKEDYERCISLKQMITIGKLQVFVIIVKPCKQPIILRKKDQDKMVEELYVRSGATSEQFTIFAFCEHWCDHLCQISRAEE